MAPVERNPPQSTGLLSGVFSFVSREIESFVTNATGGTLAEVRCKHISTRNPTHQYSPLQEPIASSSRVNYSRRRPAGPLRTERVARNRSQNEEDAGFRRRGPAKDRVRSGTPPLSRHQPRHEHDKLLHKKRTKSFSPPPRNADQGNMKAPQSVDGLGCLSSPETAPRRHSPSLMPPPMRADRMRPPVITMPGSLFPRSPSIAPEEFTQHVPEDRFTSDTWDIFSTQSPCEAGPSRGPIGLSTSENAEEPASPFPPPQPQSSVKAAVERFHIGENDADPSILLPSPTTSPTRVNGDSKGKARETYTPRERESSPSRLSYKDKGKFRTMELSPQTDNADTSSEIRVRGKEKELDAVRKEQREKSKRRERDKHQDEEDEREKQRDKDKIKTLEEEIMKLKAEVSFLIYKVPAIPLIKYVVIETIYLHYQYTIILSSASSASASATSNGQYFAYANQFRPS